MTDYRAELQRLVKAYDEHGGRWPDKDVQALHNAVEAARTTLAQPEPEADGEVAELVAWLRYNADYALQKAATATFKRFHRAADLLERPAQSETQGPTDEGLDELVQRLLARFHTGDTLEATWAMAAQWGADQERRWQHAQPEPQGPISEAELENGWNQQADQFNQWDSLSLGEQLAWAQARSLARWGRPAIEPVPVSDPPGPEDCDSEDQCWLWRTDGIEEFWELVIPSYNIHEYNWTSQWKYTHWLPHWALPVPAPANTINQNNY
jgi:hypothetical protein